jgi:hypothetical protein
MPRNVRNFWIETRIREGDGWRDAKATGPLGKDGTFTTSISIRKEGEVFEALTIEGFADDDGTLSIVVFARDMFGPNGNERVHKLECTR